MRAAVVAATARGNAAFGEGRLDAAGEAFEEAVRALGPEDDDIAPLAYENLGLALFNLGRFEAAVVAFLRALDGTTAGREQALRYLVTCLVATDLVAEATRRLADYEGTFGAHPDGWTRAAIAAR